MTVSSDRTTQVSVLELLMKWENGQDHWIRQLVSEVIETRDRLSDESIKKLYELLFLEKNLADDDSDSDSVKTPLLSYESDTPSAQAAVRLQSLQHIKGVNALAENQEILFHERMTICYGENASGKTGYVRILKRAARVRNTDPVLPNIKLNATEQHPRAKFKILAGGQECEIEWNGEQGVDPLTQIGIFDTHVSLFHLDQDLTYTYTPAELLPFELVIDGIERIRKKLQSQQPQQNPFLDNFPTEGLLYSKIKKLGTSTKLDELIMLSKVSEEEETELIRLHESVDALRSGDVRAQVNQVKREKDIFKKTLNIAYAITRFEHDPYTKALSELRAAKEAHENATNKAFIGERVPGFLSESWKNFVEAADKYIKKEIKIDFYPSSEHDCIYCRQHLGNDAVRLLEKYRDYCNDNLRKAVDKAHAKVRSLSEVIRELNIKKSELDTGDSSASVTRHGPDIRRTDIKELTGQLENPDSFPRSLLAADNIVVYLERLQQNLNNDIDYPPLPSNF